MARIRPQDALEEAERDAWKCETCSAPAEEEDRYCRHCRWYWDDVANGLFDQCEAEMAIDEAMRRQPGFAAGMGIVP